ncbi:MAG: glutamate synthase central domain-containing protein, partial [Myxococcota bacterium]
MYSYCNCVMEPWDGPAAICASDGRWIIAGMDRNGLRPLRYTITGDELLIVGSETGMVPVDESWIIEKGKLGPGQIIGVDLTEGRLYRDQELKDQLAQAHPYREWVKNITHLDSLIKAQAPESAKYERDELRLRQRFVGYTMEELEMILHPMVEDAKEVTGSMGDDTPLAVLSEHYRGLHHFFRQNFSQVTNPPIDSLREYRVMSLKTRLGNLGNVFDQSPDQTELLLLESPVLSNAEFAAMRRHMGKTAADIDATFSVDSPGDGLAAALERMRQEAEDAVRGGCTHIVLSDEKVGRVRASIPMILATAAVHNHLMRQSLRTYTSINVRSAECLDVHYFAVLIGVGATTVNAYLAQESIADRHARGLFAGLTLEDCLKRYKRAVDQGVLKIMSKMGISVISSYRGGYNFEAVGLSRAMVAEYMPGMSSRISGIGLSGIERRVRALHEKALSQHPTVLPIGGLYKYRHSGETHGFEGTLIHLLQTAVATDSYKTYRKFSEGVSALPPINLRDLMEFRALGDPVPLEEVDSITELRKRFMSGSMSLGALSPEAHETLAIAMNRMGAMSCSGEGGQLPGFKVSAEIARLRHATEGVALISPPPHHDIYSIEDLAQLIYDLKQINPEAKVSVKLVAEAGVGTIAAGVAKAKADVILISGHSGGTGASPQSSIKYAGVPWEMGVGEANQVLTLNRLRHRVKLRVDGGMKTGRDVVIAAMLGAEEFGIGTASLIAMGCIL